MARSRRILVTGVSRWWGALPVQRLTEHRDVAEVVGIDTREPRYDLGSADFLHLDVRHSLVGKLVRGIGIDTVVHTSTTVDSFDLDARQAHETNVIGTLNLLAGCAGPDSPVRRIILKSSAHVYGSRHNLPAHIEEDRRLDSNSPHAFVRDIVEVESYLADFAVRNPQIEIVMLRFVNSLNAQEPQPLARFLDLDVVPTVAGYDPVLQLIHRDDCVSAIVAAVLASGSGPFNVAAPNPVPLSTLLAAAGRLSAPLLPPFGLGLTAAALRAVGVAFLSPQLLDLLRWGRTLSTERATRVLRFTAERDTLEAYLDFVEQRRVIPFLPDRHAYQYERELEDFVRSRRQPSPIVAVAESPTTAPAPSQTQESATRPTRRPRRSRAPLR